MSQPTVLVTEPIDPAGLEILQNAPVEAVYGWQTDSAQMPEVLARTAAMVVRIEKIDAAKMRAAPNLKCVSRHGVGCDNIDLGYAKEHNITVAITASANYASVAEHVLAMLLSLTKDLPSMDKTVRTDYTNRKSFHAVDIEGRTILVLGYGRIGARVAQLCAAFGMRVLVCDVMIPADRKKIDGHEVVPDLATALNLADVLTVHVPRNAKTVDMIGREQLEMMKPGSYVINCARGGIVNEKALADLADSGHLAGVGSDVFNVEPIEPDNPLLGARHCVLSPHCASLTVEGKRKMGMQCAQNAVDFLAGNLAAENIFKI